MSIPEWIEGTRISVAIREGAFAYPIIGGIHLLAIALFGGMILATDLRLLGWALRRQPVSALIRDLRKWKWLGGVVVAVTGLLLAWAEPVRLYRNFAFWMKMIFFALVGVQAALFRRGVYRYPEKLDVALTPQARLAGALSLVLWTGLIVSGRFIAFDVSFEE
jgi:hypothetical protein